MVGRAQQLERIEKKIKRLEEKYQADINIDTWVDLITKQWDWQTAKFSPEIEKMLKRNNLWKRK